MGAFSIWHWVIVLVVVLVLFGGGGKISKLMGDFGKGLKSFKKNIKEDGSITDQDDDGLVKAISSENIKPSMEEPPRKPKDNVTNT